ncbi:STAS/SEC14 domain-containing protein [Synechococcus sp. RSCCF101]|uniref:STAS/SEC14 domain-containing protein n=1 Tax=Synechococcus sp. RSCCF101 TaxID=2511069 RepID=UPI0012468F26|nr:STAS/SEC14 domain-containing protein [Synechococcus sp. RSCCF101]QEY33008.1 STAS/SEC14 domain-containing protein [Synechococcus sp. RSCCF101]
MIELMQDLPGGTLGFVFSGEVRGEDYDTVLVPALETALHEHDRVRMLMCFPDDFQGYALGAVWDDMKTAVHHWRGFERIAVVTDVGWLKTATQAMAALMPCPMHCFPTDQATDARRWLAESLGTIHLDSSDGVVRLRLIGQLESSSYQRIDRELAAEFSHTEPVRLLIDLREFDGWFGLGAMADHLSLFREHRHIPRAVAVVGSRRWQKGLERLLSRFTEADTRFFEEADVASADQWLHRTVPDSSAARG